MNITSIIRNRLFILVFPLLGVLTAISFAVVWPTPVAATDKVSPSTESVDNLYALNSKQSSVQEESEELSALLAKAAVIYKLRDTLTKYGIPTEDNVAVSLEIVDTDPAGLIKHKKRARFEELPSGKSHLGFGAIDKSFKDAIEEDFLGPAGMMFNLNDEFLKADAIKDLSSVNKIRFKLSIEVSDQSGELKSKTDVIATCFTCPIFGWCTG